MQKNVKLAGKMRGLVYKWNQKNAVQTIIRSSQKVINFRKPIDMDEYFHRVSHI